MPRQEWFISLVPLRDGGVVRAVPSDDAVGACGISRIAHCPAMSDEVQVQRVTPALRDELGDVFMSFSGRHSRRDDSEPFEQAEYVRIDRERLSSEREQQHAPCRFRSDTVERSENRLHFLSR